jgi:putative peptidoglycan lipid II flippase
MMTAILRRLSIPDEGSVHIASTATRILALVMAAKLLVALKEVVLAYRFGVGTVVDSYNVAYTIATWFPLLIATAAGTALVPMLVSLRRTPDQQRVFVAELNAAAWLIAGLLLALTFLFGPAAARLIAEGLAPATRGDAARMARELCAFAPLVVLAGYYSLRLQSEEHFFYSFLEAMPALFLSLFALFAAPSLGVTALVLGTIAGGVVQLAWLMAITRRTSAGLGNLRLAVASPAWAVVWRGLGAMAVGQFLIFATVPIEQYFAGHATSGGIAMMSYANRIISLITGLGTVVLARALLPILSSAVAEGDLELARRQAMRWAGISLSLGLVATLVGWFAAETMIRILLQRGAFGPADTALVGGLLRLGLLQLPFYLGGIVIVQWMASRGFYRLIAMIAASSLVVKITLLVLLTRLGVAGVMLSTVGMYLSAFALQFICLRTKK